MTQRSSQWTATVFLALSIIFLLATIWYHLPPGGQRPLLLVMTGFAKGRLKPSQAKFLPYRGKWMGGVDHLATVLEHTLASWTERPHAVFSLGSELSGTADAYFSQGEAMVKVLNHLGLSGMLLGNIEFSFGHHRLAELSELSEYAFLSSNIRSEGTGKTPDFIKQRLLLFLSQGVKLGVLGISPPDTPEVTARGNVAGLEFLSPGDWLLEEVAGLRAAGADVVVLLTQYDQAQITQTEWDVIARARPDVCFLVDYEIEAPEPSLRDGVIVKTVSGYNRTQELDLLELQIVPGSGRVVTFKGQRIAVRADRVTPQKDLSKLVQNIGQETRTSKIAPVGHFLSDYQRQYHEECPIGNMIADSTRLYCAADLAFQNSGGIQGNIHAGMMTEGDLFDILPFDNQIISMDLTGQEIRDILLQSITLKHGLLQVSGGSYVFSAAGADGYELKGIMVASSPLSPHETYRVAANSFLADGGDGYLGFRHGRNLRPGPLQRDVVRAHIGVLCASQAADLTCEGRILLTH